MAIERAPVAGGSVDDVLVELTDATRRIERLLDRAPTPEHAKDLAVVRDALLRAHRAVDSRDTTVRELGHSVSTLARELLESHAEFAEWMRDPPDSSPR